MILLYRAGVSRLPTSIVNGALTIFSWVLVRAAALCHGRTMAQQNKLGGGCFLVAAILIGFVAGLATGNAMRGVVIGMGVGILIAVAVWLFDRARH